MVSKTIRKSSAILKYIFLSIFADFGSNLAVQIDQQLKNSCIKKGSDFKSKLYFEITPIDPSSWSGAAPLGGRPRPTTRLAGRRTPYQLRLKIAPFFDAVFLQFLIDLGSQDASKIRRNPEKMLFKIALDFRIVFDTIFHQIS